MVIYRPVGAIDGEGHNGDIATDNRVGIKGEIAAVHVNAFAASLVHSLLLGGGEGVGVIGTALVGDAYTLRGRGDVDVIGGVHIQKLVLFDIIEHLGEYQ